MAIALLVIWGGNLCAQTDVFKEVTGKIANPSFEADETTVADTDKDNKVSDWTFTQNNGRIAVFNSSSADDTYGSSSPSNGTYYVRIRTAGGSSSDPQTLTSASAFSLEKGTYRVRFDYKAAKVHTYAKKFTVYAMDGSTSLGSKENSIPKVNSSSSYFSGISWTTDNFSFDLFATTDVTIKIVCEGSSSSAGRTVLALDNFILDRNLTQSLISLIDEATLFYYENTSYTDLKDVIDDTDPSSTDTDDLETQYKTLSDALDWARANKAWNTARSTLDALDEDALPSAAKDAITSALGETEPTTTDGYNTATEALQGLIDSYAGILAAYDKVKALITLATNEKTYSAGADGAKSTLNTAIGTANTNKEECTDVSGLTSVYSTLESARQTYVISGAEPDAGHPFDWTFKLSNPNFEDSPLGWALNKGTTNSTDCEVKTNESEAQDGEKYYNAWAQQIEFIEVYQNVTLPLGDYTLKGYLYTGSGGKKAQHIYAHNGADNSSSNLSSEGAWVQLEADFKQTSSSSVKIGVYSAGNNVNNDSKGWFRADNFQLFYNGQKPILNDVIESATALSTKNVGSEAFQIPTSCAADLVTAIGTAQGVYDNSSKYGSDIATEINNLNTEISDYNTAVTTAVLNAPDPAKKYYIKVATTGHAKKDNAVVVALGSTSATNPTGYTFNASAAPAAYLCQAFTFTQVSGNTYQISINRPEGEVYLTNGTKNGSTSGWKESQIQGTTESEDAMTFTIKVSSNDGAFNIYNSETNSTIACQAAGNLYTEAGNADFALAEASQASVTVSCNAGKYGTVIFPFTPNVSTGFEKITFYSCSSVNGETNKAQLSEVLDAPAANTPYLIKNDDEEKFTKTLTGWGTASAASSKPDGSLLTGVYTNSPITHDAHNYVLQTQEGVQAFYLVKDEDFEATPYKCYLTYAEGPSVKAFFFDGDETAVSSVKADELQDATIYNLAGQRVNKAQKGVYIINGKKVAVK